MARMNLGGQKLKVVEDALDELGYNFLGGKGSRDWKMGQYHVVVRSKGWGVAMHIHKDPKYEIGRIRRRGNDLDERLKNIAKKAKENANRYE